MERTKQLQAANKELEAFAYSVSHDLRTPLRGIDGFSQILLEEYQDKLDENGKNYLHRVRSASQRLAHLIDDMLHLSHIGREEMNIGQVNLSEIAHNIANELTEDHPERDVNFIIQEGIKVQGDGHLLRIVLENLLGNAWKFTSKHAHARIEFGAEQQDEKTIYFVRDDGAGFDMNYAGKIFGAFQRLHTDTEFPGTGIGLTTVQRVIQRHGGKIWAEGEVEKGATFYFTIP
jgi:light-regulated signal transduction histidine kinase (bacteriophytochrome)